MKVWLKKILSALSVLVILTTLNSCGEKSEADSNTAQEIEDRKVLAQNFEDILGVYTGVVSNNKDGEDPFPVEITIYSVDVENGTNADGELKFIPVAKAHYRRTDIIDKAAEYVLSIRYYKETTAISMASKADPSARVQGAGFLSIAGYLKGGVLTGSIKNNNGPLGEITASKKVR